MLVFRCFVFFTTLIASCHYVGAGVVSRDLIEPGDGLLTYDDVNHREWLDFEATAGMNVSDVFARTLSTGDLSGFEFASLEEIQGLAESAGVPFRDSSMIPVGSPEVASELIDLIGWTFRASGDHVFLWYAGGVVPSGRLANGTPKFSGESAIVINACWDEGCSPIVGLNNPATTQPGFGVLHAISDPFFGTSTDIANSYWLYREAPPLPEPAAILLISAAFLGTLASLRLRAFALYTSQSLLTQSREAAKKIQ